MDSATEHFNFMSAYRLLRPNETREIIDARATSFSALKNQTNTREQVRDLCRLAFQLPLPKAEAVNWFAEALNKPDNQFTMEVDRVEAGLIAGLLLKERMFSDSALDMLFVLSTWVEGSREPIISDLPSVASKGLAKLAGRTTLGRTTETEYPEGDKSATQIEAAKKTFNGEMVGAALSAIADNSHESGAILAKKVTDALRSEQDARSRLAEELNMLWWYIGEWSRLIDKPRKDFPPVTLPIIVGVDLGCFVHKLPGPYGALAVLKRSLAPASDQLATLSDAIDALPSEANRAISAETSLADADLYPVHFAIKLVEEIGHGQWKSTFERTTNLPADMTLTQSQLATQAYRERILLNTEALR